MALARPNGIAALSSVARRGATGSPACRPALLKSRRSSGQIRCTSNPREEGGMSVLMTVVANGDPRKLEEHAASDPAAMHAILDSAKRHGLIAHRFYGSDDGQIMVVDEWPDEQSFQSFFEETGDRIMPMFQAAGVTSEPQPKFWRELESDDAYGWGA